MSQANNPAQAYQSADEIEEIVRRFERCTLGAAEFRHREHLTVIAWYLSELPTPEAAAARMREGLYKFLAQHGHGSQKYHETITLFWAKRVSALLRQAGREQHLAELTNKVIEICGDAGLVHNYYSRELLASDEARKEWVEPDLQPLDF